MCSIPSTLKIKLKEKKMKNKKVLFITQAALIAAIYVVLTVLGAAYSFGEIQVRLAEILTILPAFTPAAVPGLFIGCLLGNSFAGAHIMDIIFGSIATLVAAAATYVIGKKANPKFAVYLGTLPPIIVNMLVVPFVLKYAYGLPLPIYFMMITVGIGEVISCGVLGSFFGKILEKNKRAIFQQN